MNREKLTNFAGASLRLLALLLRLMPARLAAAVASSVAALLSHLFSRERRIAEAQLAFAFGGSPDQYTKSYRAVFRHVGATLAELVHSEQLLPAGQPSQIEYRPNSHFRCSDGAQDAMLQLSGSGRALLALAGHIGNFEIQAAFYARCGVPLYVIGRRPNYESVSRFLEDLRRRHLLVTIWREDPASPRKLIKALKSGGVIGALLDQDIDLENGFAKFFGLDAASPIAPIRLAVKYGVPIIYSFSERVSPLSHLLHSGRINYESCSSEAEAIQIVLDQYNSKLEEIIRRRPEQWIWWHRRWRRRPGTDYGARPELLRSSKDYAAWIEQQREPRTETSAF